MSKPKPTINDYMTPSPITIGAEQTVARAHEVMREHRIRHLPVLHGGGLAGILTQRDIALVEGLRDVDPNLVLVDDAMSLETYAVSPGAALEEVVSEMATHKYGSAVVLQDGKVVGILTAVDVCSALAAMLKSERSKPLA